MIAQLQVSYPIWRPEMVCCDSQLCTKCLGPNIKETIIVPKSSASCKYPWIAANWVVTWTDSNQGEPVLRCTSPCIVQEKSLRISLELLLILVHHRNSDSSFYSWSIPYLLWKMTLLENMYQGRTLIFQFWAQPSKADIWRNLSGIQAGFVGTLKDVWIWIRNRCLLHQMLKSQQVKVPFFLTSLAVFPKETEAWPTHQGQDISVSHQMRKWSNLWFMAPGSIPYHPKLATTALNSRKSQLSSVV